MSDIGRILIEKPLALYYCFKDPEAYRVAREKVVIADYNEAGFPHSADEYKIVDFNWLESKLSQLGKTETYVGEQINLYICFKRR